VPGKRAGGCEWVDFAGVGMPDWVSAWSGSGLCFEGFQNERRSAMKGLAVPAVSVAGATLL
jgi:hypothetical protein